jgi:Ca2+/H+ antiporter
MKFQTLSFTIPVLVLAGVFFSVWGYFNGGLPKAMELAVVWLTASTVAILLGRWLRRSTQVKK